VGVGEGRSLSDADARKSRSYVPTRQSCTHARHLHKGNTNSGRNLSHGVLCVLQAPSTYSTLRDRSPELGHTGDKSTMVGVVVTHDRKHTRKDILFESRIVSHKAFLTPLRARRGLRSLRVGSESCARRAGEGRVFLSAPAGLAVIIVEHKTWRCAGSDAGSAETRLPLGAVS
jgi:hypothetical protein